MVQPRVGVLRGSDASGLPGQACALIPKSPLIYLIDASPSLLQAAAIENGARPSFTVSGGRVPVRCDSCRAERSRDGMMSQ